MQLLIVQMPPWECLLLDLLQERLSVLNNG